MSFGKIVFDKYQYINKPFHLFIGFIFTPGRIHSISNRRFAAINAVLPDVSYGGDTYRKK